MLIVDLHMMGSFEIPGSFDVQGGSGLAGLVRLEGALAVLEEVKVDLADVERAIVVGDLAHFERALLPVAFVDDAIISNEGAFAVELVVREVSSVQTSVREGKRSLTVEQTVRELAFVDDVLARFFAVPSWQIIFELT